MSYIEEGRYLEGYLEWKGPKSKNFQKVWTTLHHTAVYFYQNRTVDMRDSLRKQQTPLACVHIDGQTVFEIEKKDTLKFSIQSPQGIHRCKAYKAEDVDRWRAYIVSFSQRSIPQEISQIILPGQRNDIYRALEQEFSSLQDVAPPVPESARPKHNLRGSFSSTGSGSSAEQKFGRLSISSTGSGGSVRSLEKEQSPDIRYYPDHLKDLTEPTWFFPKISRQESEEILENNKDKGDILIRKRDVSNEFVLSARLFVNNKQDIRHYLIKKQGNVFVLDIDEQHPPILNLYELLNYFIHKTGGYPVLRPLVTNDHKLLKLPARLYERGFLTRADQDPDSGEWGPRPIPPEIYEQSDYLEPEDPKLQRTTKQSTPLPPVPVDVSHSYINQGQIPGNRRGPKQLIPRPVLSMESGKEDTEQGYYNADAINLHQQRKRESMTSSPVTSDLMYQNQPPLPPSRASTVDNNAPQPPPLHTMPTRKTSTSQPPCETGLPWQRTHTVPSSQSEDSQSLHQKVTTAKTGYSPVHCDSAPELPPLHTIPKRKLSTSQQPPCETFQQTSELHPHASQQSEESQSLCQQVATAKQGLKPVNRDVRQKQMISQQAQALTSELANALARRKQNIQD